MTMERLMDLFLIIILSVQLLGGLSEKNESTKRKNMYRSDI
jgi:hypothetical protein